MPEDDQQQQDKGDDKSQQQGADAGKDQAAETEKWKALARKHEKDAKTNADAARRLAEIDEQNKDANQKAIDAARKDERDIATKETSDRYRRKIVTAEVKAAAGAKLADPADAVRLLDLDDFDLDDNDEVDPKKVSAAIDKLLTDKPYLAGTQGGGQQQRRPGFDQGNRGNHDKPSGSDLGRAEAERRFPQLKQNK